jgi:transcriptional regulator with XRE-family HTH domain
MHRTYLAGIERALRNPSLENLVKLANATGITLAELFGEPTPARGAQRP